MSAPVLLRVLLCLLLVLNGTGTAVAAAQMAMQHAAPDCHSMVNATDAAAVAKPGQAAMAHHPAPGSATPCHDATQAVQFAEQLQSPPDDTGEGCCDSGQCACLQQVLATATLEALPAATPDSQRANRHPPAGHVPPTLAHLIRPPIG